MHSFDRDLRTGSYLSSYGRKSGAVNSSRHNTYLGTRYNIHTTPAYQLHQVNTDYRLILTRHQSLTR